MATQTYNFGNAPSEVITTACQSQCPDGYSMHIKSQVEWQTISHAVNQGIDSHLEALTSRSSFDHDTGQCLVHPEELHVLLRRMFNSGDDESWSLRSAILSTLDIEEI